jgi:hypothetical protein
MATELLGHGIDAEGKRPKQNSKESLSSAGLRGVKALRIAAGCH